MSLINRICCFLFVLLLLAAGAVLILDILGFTIIIDSFYAIFSIDAYRNIMLICGGILIVLGLLIILAKILMRPPKKAKIPAVGDRDVVYITLATLEDMAKNTALAIPGVVGIHTKVKTGQGGLFVYAKVRVSYDDQVTAITSRLQDDIKLVIESSTTLPVKRVSVYVTKAAGETSAANLRQRPEDTVDYATYPPPQEENRSPDVEDFRRE